MPQLWTNWAREQRCAPERIARPTSEGELAELVGSAAASTTPVRVVGSGHSFTDCACTDGVMVDLGAMTRVVEADTESGLVTVESGITLHELGKQLAARGLAMENQGDIDRQTLAGAISTATHGTGGRYPKHLVPGGRPEAWSPPTATRSTSGSTTPTRSRRPEWGSAASARSRR